MVRMSTSDPLFSNNSSVTGRGNKDEAKRFMRNAGSKWPVEEFIDEIYRLAPIYGFDPAIAIAQCSQETGYFKEPVYWARDRNPAGVGIYDNGIDSLFTGISGKQAAAVYVMELFTHKKHGTKPSGQIFTDIYNINPPQGYINNDWDTYKKWVDNNIYLNNNGNYPTIAVLRDLAQSWRTTGGWTECVWACDPNYATSIVTKGNTIFASLGSSSGGSSTIFDARDKLHCASNTRLRYGAGTDQGERGMIYAGQEVCVISGPYTATGYTWYRIYTPTSSSVTGYVAMVNNNFGLVGRGLCQGFSGWQGSNPPGEGPSDGNNGGECQGGDCGGNGDPEGEDPLDPRPLNEKKLQTGDVVQIKKNRTDVRKSSSGLSDEILGTLSKGAIAIITSKKATADEEEGDSWQEVECAYGKGYLRTKDFEQTKIESLTANPEVRKGLKNIKALGDAQISEIELNNNTRVRVDCPGSGRNEGVSFRSKDLSLKGARNFTGVLDIAGSDEIDSVKVILTYDDGEEDEFPAKKVNLSPKRWVRLVIPKVTARKKNRTIVAAEIRIISGKSENITFFVDNVYIVELTTGENL